jgi:hypothetical protein
MVRTELWFGIGFLLLAAVIFGTLAATRQKEAGSGTDSTPSSNPDDPDDDSAPLVLSRKRLLRRPVNDLTPRARPKAEETPAAKPQPKKPRRLIQ